MSYEIIRCPACKCEWGVTNLPELNGNNVRVAELLSQLAATQAMIKSADEKLEAASDKVDIHFGCDTAEALADVILDYRRILAASQARLAAYEEGYDPKVQTPQHDQWILVKHMNDDPADAPVQAKYDSGDDGENGVKYYPYSEEGWVYWTNIVRWFPTPGSKEAK